MKSLIIATGRCGSSALSLAIADKFNCNLYDEPFNPWQNYTESETGNRHYNTGTSEPKLKIVERDLMWEISDDWKNVPKNTVWKCILSESHYPNEELSGKISQEEFFLNFSKSFDNVILLSRRNHGERLYSLLHAIKYHTWHHKDVNYDSHRVILQKHDYQTINDFVYQIERIEFLSKTLDKEIFYYEDLFTDLEISEKTWNRIVGKVDDYESIYQKWLNPIYKDRIGIKPGFDLSKEEYT